MRYREGVMDQTIPVGRQVWLSSRDCSLDDFRALTEIETTPATVPLADEIRSKLPVYHGPRIRDAVAG